MIFDFIWSYKKHLISKEQLQLPKELGGMGIVNVRLKIKAQRIKFITRRVMEIVSRTFSR